MDQRNLHELLWQVPAEEVGVAFRGFLHEHARSMILEAMAQEVAALCGVAYHPQPGASCRRAGSARGRILVEGCKEAVRRPRVRRGNASGGEDEVLPASYLAAQDSGAVRDALLRAIAAGVSTREVRRLFPRTPTSSSSAVSRLWIKEGGKLFAAFRERDLAKESWFGLMLDGVHLANDLVAVVALGLTVDGRKMIFRPLHLLRDFRLCPENVKLRLPSAARKSVCRLAA